MKFLPKNLQVSKILSIFALGCSMKSALGYDKPPFPHLHFEESHITFAR